MTVATEEEACGIDTKLEIETEIAIPCDRTREIGRWCQTSKRSERALVKGGASGDMGDVVMVAQLNHITGLRRRNVMARVGEAAVDCQDFKAETFECADQPRKAALDGNRWRAFLTQLIGNPERRCQIAGQHRKVGRIERFPELRQAQIKCAEAGVEIGSNLADAVRLVLR